MQTMKIAVSWGKTGGHVFPIISWLQKKPSEVETLWIWNANSLEEKVAQEYDIPFASVDISISNKLSIVTSVAKAIKIFRDENIKGVFIKGWFVSFPALIAAKLLKIPFVGHESDAIGGRVSNWVHRLGGSLFCAFEWATRWCIKSGPLLNEELISWIWSGQGVDNIDNVDRAVSKTHVVVMGGSQGARRIFEGLAKILPNTEIQKAFDFRIILWSANISLAKMFEKFSNVEIYHFLSQAEMGKIYDRADVSITRGGANSLFEQMLFNIKKVIIPLPFASQNHQFLNALYFSQHEGDVLIEENVLWEEDLLKSLLELRNFKKNRTYGIKSLKKEIDAPKEIIWKFLLEKIK